MQTLQPSVCCPGTGCSISNVSLQSLIDAAVGDATCCLTFDLVADLQASTAHVDKQQATVSGLNAIDDGFGGIWIYRASSTAAADGYSVIQPDDVTGDGRWLKFL